MRNDHMDHKVQLKHPQGKKPISMSKEKYDLLKQAMLNCLHAQGKATFKEMVIGIEKDFKRNRTKFQGSLPWHVEWMKLDLEARKVIKRVASTSPQQYILVR